MGRDTGPEMPPTHLCLTGHGSHPLFPLPTLSSPCSRLDSRLEGTGRKAGGGGPSPLPSLNGLQPTHPTLESIAVMNMQSSVYTGEIQEGQAPCGATWGGLESLPKPILFHPMPQFRLSSQAALIARS